MKKETKIQELERRIAELEKRPVFITHPVYDPRHFTTQPPHHYHNGMPCYQNPCTWC